MASTKAYVDMKNVNKDFPIIVEANICKRGIMFKLRLFIVNLMFQLIAIVMPGRKIKFGWMK